jgi:hypothetical protein
MTPIATPDPQPPKGPSRHHAHRPDWQQANDDAAEQQRDDSRTRQDR